MHSVVREIAVPPAGRNVRHGINNDYESSLSFRQPARSQAPLPLKSRELAFVLPREPTPQATFEHGISQQRPSARQGGSSRSSKPAPINIQLAEEVGTKQEFRPVKSAPLRGLVLAPLSAIGAARKGPPLRTQGLKYPKTAGLEQSWTMKADKDSPIQRLPLTPLDTELTPGSRRSIVVDFTLSPSLVPLVSQKLSPISQGRSTQTSSPSAWSPQTPRAMSFDNVTVVNDTTPPMPTLEWLQHQRDTIIEEEVQEATPLEADPPRGRIIGISTHAPTSVNRARSMSPPPSAYPKDSTFSWDLADVTIRSATDDDLYCLTPIELPQMIEDDNYKPAKSAFDIRQTILGSYFGR